MSEDGNDAEETKVEQPLIATNPSLEIEDEPLSSTVEKTKVTATDTSPPLPALVSDEASEEVVHQPNYTSNGTEEINLIRYHQGHFRDDPVGFMMQMGAFYQGTGWRSYKGYIGRRIFYEGYTKETKERILKSERVRRMIERLAGKQANSTPKSILKIKKELQAVANGIVDKLIADMSSLRFIRFFGFFTNNMLVRMYHQGIHISEREFLELRRVAIRAAQDSQSLIILPCHKSHIDYLVISYIFFQLGLALPHIVAGDNLDLPIAGRFLRRGGAFFIRRTWGEDQLYSSVVKEYIEGLLECGHNVECFIEGTRSRTGKLLPPKLGVLKIILDCILSGRAKDCWIVPTSIHYDRVIETETYYNELLGNPKERESLWGILTNTRLLQLKWGRIDVRFSKPYSLQNFINQRKEQRKDFDPTNDQQKVILLRALGYQVLSDINAVHVVMPTALVGTVLLTLRGRGVGRNELIRRVDWLREAIIAKKGRVADFGNKTTEEIVDRAVAVLKDLIQERKELLLEPIFYAEKSFELSFYRNQTMHLFVSEAILSAAMYTKIKIGGVKSTQRLHFDTVLEEVTFLSQLLKVEFVYQPGKIETNLQHTIEKLKKDNVFYYDGEYLELSDVERDMGRENYDFYCFLIWPFIETYWLAAVSLFSMTPTNPAPEPTSVNRTDPITWFSERDFHEKCQLFGKTLYYQGDLSYFEAINKETLKNAFIRYEEMGIIKVKHGKNSKIALHPDYIPTRNSQGTTEASGKLWDLVERIGKFRREGKNRRDNATVSSRVLRLAEMNRLVGAGKHEAKL